MNLKKHCKTVGVLLVFVLVSMTMTAALATQPKDHIKACFVYDSPLGDTGVGWNYQHDVGRQYLEKNLGSKVHTMYIDSIPPEQSESVLRKLASSGCNMVVTPSFAFMNPTIKIARQLPNVVFLNATGYKTAHNVSTYRARNYQVRYLAGMVAGLMTKNNHLGFVGSHPIPQIILGLNAYMRGVRSVNPDAKLSVIWINEWFDPTKAREAANTLIDQGADVLAYWTNSYAVAQVSSERQTYVVGTNGDLSKYGGKYVLTSTLQTWGPFYVEEAREILDGTWQSSAVWYGLKHNMVSLAPFSPVVSSQIRQRVMKAKQKIISGNLHVFSGPIISNTGELKLPKGEVMSDEAMLAMDYYVQGISSKFPHK